MIGWLCGLHPAVQRLVLSAIIAFGAIYLPWLSYVVFGLITICWGPDLLSDCCQRRHAASWLAKLTATHAEVLEDLARTQAELRAKDTELAEARTIEFQLRGSLMLARNVQWAPPQSPSKPEGKSPRDRLYGRLGLTPAIPDAYLPHIRRGVLMALHPDRHPEHLRKAAHVRYLDAMDVLDQIEKDRTAHSGATAASRAA